MCYDAKTSIGTFVLVSGISLYLWNRNTSIDRPLALIFMVIVTMQLAEFLLWSFKEANKYVTPLLPVILYSQPLLIALIMWIFKAGYFVESYKYITYGLLIALPFFILNLKSFLSAPITKLSPTNHLEWPLIEHDIPITIYYALLFYLFATLKRPFIAIALLTGYYVSWKYYKHYYKREWSSMWCHSVNMVALLSLL